jgi:hypothetical protein
MDPQKRILPWHVQKLGEKLSKNLRVVAVARHKDDPKVRARSPKIVLL